MKHRRPQKMPAKNKSFFQRRLFIAFLSLALAFAQAPPAKADATDVPFLTAIESSDLAMKIEQVLSDTWTHLQLAANTMAATLGQYAHLSALVDALSGQDANADLRAKGQKAADIADKQTLAPDTRLGCPADHIAARNNVALGANAMAASTEAYQKNRQQGAGAPVLATSLTDGMKHGFRDCSSTSLYGDKLQQLNVPGCSSTPIKINNEDFTDADTRLGSVLDQDQYSIPAQTGFNSTKTKLVFPPITSISNDITGQAEEHYIAAYYYCARWQPYQPPPPTGKGQKFTNDDLKIEPALDAVAKASGPYKICLDAMARRTAISQKAASALGGSWQDMYNTQVQACLQMANMGYLTTNEMTNCKTNGMSQIAMQRHAAYRFGQANYISYLAGQKQVSADKISELQETEGYAAILAFENGLTAEKIGVATALNGAMNAPVGPESNPAAHPVGQQ